MAKPRPRAAISDVVDPDDLEEPRVVDLGDLSGSKGKAKRFYLVLLVVVLLVYPFVDPALFGPGSEGRIAGYGDAGFYVILALGLNIVVGFAGLLDLGYVAFFAIGAYAWGMIASPQFGFISGVQIPAQLWPWLCWPLLIAVGLLTALWGACAATTWRSSHWALARSSPSPSSNSTVSPTAPTVSSASTLPSCRGSTGTRSRPSPFIISSWS